MKPDLVKRLARIRVTLPTTYFEMVWNALRDRHIKSKLHCTAEGSFFFHLTISDWQALQQSYPTMAAEAVTKEIGLLPFLKNHRQRFGLLLGGVLAVFLFVCLENRLWDVRIQGNESLSDMQITEELEAAGLIIGTPLAEINSREIADNVLIASSQLSYVSIHVRGNVAYVQVMERKANENVEQNGKGVNLIASADAVIDTLSVAHGTILVKPGQVVQKGQLLVSGITEGSAGSRITQAEGEIYGRVTQHFSLTLPRKMVQSQRSAQKTTAFSLFLWGKNINIYTNTGNLPPSYDTIYEKEWLYLGDATRLPIGFTRSVAVWDEQSEAVLDDEALVALAYRRLMAQVTRELSQGELLNKKITGEFTEDSYILHCEVECLINIAACKEFDTAG